MNRVQRPCLCELFLDSGPLMQCELSQDKQALRYIRTKYYRTLPSPAIRKNVDTTKWIYVLTKVDVAAWTMNLTIWNAIPSLIPRYVESHQRFTIKQSQSILKLSSRTSFPISGDNDFDPINQKFAGVCMC